MNEEIRIGDTFKIKSSVTVEDLSDISYDEESANWILNQKDFLRIEPHPSYKQDINKIWYNNKYLGGRCYLTMDMVEPLTPRGYNHPLTKMFKF